MQNLPGTKEKKRQHATEALLAVVIHDEFILFSTYFIADYRAVELIHNFVLEGDLKVLFSCSKEVAK
jgi:hypothetical protein